jgi:guanine nucleotide-binding protein G(i) subunit alpha
MCAFPADTSQAGADRILDYNLSVASDNPSYYFPEDLAEAIRQLWQDPIIQKIMDHHSSEFYLMDSAS